MTEPRMTVHHCGECNSKLFLQWGFSMLVTPATWMITETGRESGDKDKVEPKDLYVCAICKHPYFLEEGGVIHDAEEHVSKEDVYFALETLRNARPAAVKARALDP